MLSPRRGLLSPYPIGGVPWPLRIRRERERKTKGERRQESEVESRGKREREEESPFVATKREKRGARMGRDISSRVCAVAKSSQESVGQPTTDREARPPHYAHRSRYFNVPVETTGASLRAEGRISRDVLRAVQVGIINGRSITTRWRRKSDEKSWTRRNCASRFIMSLIKSR